MAARTGLDNGGSILDPTSAKSAAKQQRNAAISSTRPCQYCGISISGPKFAEARVTKAAFGESSGLPERS